MARHAREQYLVRGQAGEMLRLQRGKGSRMRGPPQPGDPPFACRHLFGRAAPGTHPDPDALEALGRAMVAHPPHQRDHGAIPAGYTYLGQFIFHDITHLDVSEGVDAATTLRTPVLDLDSVLPQSGFAALCDDTPRGDPLPLGLTSQGRPIPYDLPRRAWRENRPGVPLIADERNDDFLPLAQCHMMLLRFFNAVARSRGRGGGASWWNAVRRRWRQHFQSVVLHDFLPRVVERAIHDDVMRNGRRLVRPAARGRSDHDWLPIEFPGAVARFGHSMIRDDYRPWNRSVPRRRVDAHRFMSFSYRNSGDRLARHNGALPTHWVTNWFHLFDFTDVRPDRARPQPLMAARIGPRLTGALGRLPLCLQQDACNGTPGRQRSFSLAVATLLRGAELELASAQQALDAAAALGNGVSPARLAEHQLAEPDGPIADAFAAHPRLREHTPLWYYVLREAEVLGEGLRLGPLGGRLVMETVHAAIEESPDSILSVARWRPTLPSAHPDIFTMPDLIAFSGDPDPLGA